MTAKYTTFHDLVQAYRDKKLDSGSPLQVAVHGDLSVVYHPKGDGVGDEEGEIMFVSAGDERGILCAALDELGVPYTFPRDGEEDDD